MSRYVFDSSAVQAPERFSALETCYDPVLSGGGGGGGSLGAWLADVVGPTGEVLLTDLVPQVEGPPGGRPNLKVTRHDIVNDALPDDTFDLVHARLVLLHLPQRREVLDRLVSALKPGGRLVLEEFDCGWIPVLSAPDPGAAGLFDKVHTHLMRLLTEAGADPLWGRRVYGAMVRAGLTDLSPGNSPSPRRRPATGVRP